MASLYSAYTLCMHTLSISFSRFNYHGNWFNNGLSRWPVPSSPLLNPTSYPQSSPLLSPKWPPLSPLLSPYQGDFTQGNHQEPPFWSMRIDWRVNRQYLGSTSMRRCLSQVKCWLGMGFHYKLTQNYDLHYVLQHQQWITVVFGKSNIRVVLCKFL